MPISNYLERKSVEAFAENDTIVKVSGNMPKDTLLDSSVIGKEEATELALKHLPGITSGDVLCAYDISMSSNSLEYQPGDYNQVVMVNISNLDLDIKDTVALLHIIDDESFEILPVSRVDGNEIEFKATSFSPYILIYVDTYEVSFSGDGNFKVFDIEGNEIKSGDVFDEEKVVDGVLVPAGTNFNFVLVPNDGYGITDVTLLDATADASGDNYLEISGYVLGKTGKINKVTQNLQLDVITALAPKITMQPVNCKTKFGTSATYTITAENATTFTWQYRENSNDYWKDVTNLIGTSTVSGNSSTLTTIATSFNLSGFEFRCLVGDDNFTGDESVKSNVVLLTVAQDEIAAGDAPIVMEHPQNQKVIMGNTASFEVTAMGTNLTFEWQYRENQDDYWKTVTSTVGTSKLSTPAESTAEKPLQKSTFTTVASTYQMTGYEFRCLVGNRFYKYDDAVKSNIVNLIVTNGGDEINVQYFELDFIKEPVSQKVKLGEIATFTVEAVGASTYKWQYRNMSGDNYWEDVDDTIGRGYNTNTLSIDTSKMVLDEETLEVSNSLSGYEFRCIIVNNAVPTFEKESKTAFLIVAQDTITMFVEYLMPEINFTASSGDSASAITVTWDMTPGINYSLYYINESGGRTLLANNVTTPYIHKNLRRNTVYEYVIEGLDPNDPSYIETETAIGYTAYQDIYDVINRDTTKPIIDNINITPASGIIGPSDEITLTFNVIDEHYDKLNGSLLYPDDIEILVNGLDAGTARKELTKANIPSGERFTLTVNNIWGDGDISIKIPGGAIKDLASNGNDEYIINTELEVVRNKVHSVTNFYASSGESANYIKITWEDAKNTGDITYILEASAKDNEWVVLKNNATSPYYHTNLTKNMSFEYRIKAIDSEGNESQYVYTIGRTEYDSIYGDVMIDTVNPVINLTGINPDIDYIGSTQELTITFESFDENYNLDLSNVDENSFIVKVAGKEIADVNRTLTKENIVSGERFTLTISNVTGTGELTILIPEGVIRDSALNPNLDTELNTEVIAMNGETITKDAPTLVPDVHEISVTTNQVNTIPIESIIYEYRVSGDAEFIKWIETTDRNIVITGLSSDTDYEVRTTVIDVANNSVTSDSSFTTTKKIDASAIIITHESQEWTNLVAPNPEVTATIGWNDVDYIHQYSFDNLNWIEGTGNKTNIPVTQNVTIYARYSDGVGHSDPVEHKIENIDLIKPTIGEVTVPSGKANTKQIKVTSIKDEGGSGIKAYFVNTVADFTNAEWQTLAQDNFEFTATENIIYYIWVMDNAGNISEAATANVKDIVDKVKDITADSEVEVKVFDTVTPSLTYSGEPEDIIWEITDESIATINPDTGEITGVASGETTAKVTIKDYDGTETTVEIKVIVRPADTLLVINEPKEFTFVYGDAASETTFTYNGSGDISVSTSDTNVATAVINGNRIIITPGEVGNAVITVKASATKEYHEVSAEIPVTVNQRVVELTWIGKEFTYDGDEKTVTATIDNIVNSDDVTITYSGNKETEAGEYTAEAISLQGTKAKNYTLENCTTKTHAWKINRKDRELNVSTENITVMFGKPQTVTFDYTGEDTLAEILISDTTVIDATLVDGNNSGDIEINALKTGVSTITITVPETKNYNAISKEIKVIGEPSNEGVKVDVPEYEVEYGTPAFDVVYEYDGNGEVTVTTSDPNVVDINHNSGDKKITIIPGNASENEVIITIKTEATDQHQESEATIKVKVKPRIVELIWGETTFEYDGTDKQVSATINNLVGSDNVVISYSGNKEKNAGNYIAEITGLSNPNYTIVGAEKTKQTWEITRIDINPTLTMDGYIYGGVKSTPVIEGNIENGKETFYVYSGDDETTAIDWETVKTSTTLEPGTYKMYAIVSETTNYNEAKTNTVEFQITVQGIEVELKVNGEEYNGEWTNQNVTATITVPEAITTMESVYYKIGENGTFTLHENTSKNANVITITFDKNINSEVYFVAVNVAGNEITAPTDAHTIKIDKDKPTIGSVVIDPEGTSNTKDIIVSGIADTGESGIYGYYVGTETDITKITWTPLTENNFTYEISENGIYNIYVRDTAGNVSDIVEGITKVEIANIVDEITNASVKQNLEVEVFKTLDPELEFSGEAKSITYTVENPDIATIDQATGIITATNAGETKIIITIENYDEDKADIVLETTLKVTPRKVSLTWSGDIFVYDGSEKTVTATVMGTRDEDIVTVTLYKDNAKTEAGKYTAEALELSDSNYTLEGIDTKEHSWEIMESIIDPILVMKDYTYGGDKPQPEVVGNHGNGKVTIYVYSGDNVENKINWETVTSSIYLAPGTYKMYAEVEATANYTAGTTETVTFTITIKDIEVELTENGTAYDNEWTNNDIIATITVPEDVTTMTTVYYKGKNDATWRSDAATVKNGNIVTITFSENIEDEISFVAVNAEGKHITTESIAYVIKTEKVKPEIGNVIITPPNTEKSNTKLIEVSGIVDEGGSGIYGYYIGEESNVNTITWTPLATDNFNLTVSKSGIYNVYVKDVAGNVSDLYEIEIENVVDKTTNVIVPDVIQLQVSEKVTPEIKYSGEPEEITWEIVDNGVATIDPSTGEITGVASGETTVTVTIKDYDGTEQKFEIPVIVKALVPVLEIEDIDEFRFVYGDPAIETEFRYNGDGEVVISSDDENVATVIRDGNQFNVKPVKVGITNIRFVASETPSYVGVELVIPVTVSPKPVILTWTNDTFTYDGEEKTILATVSNPVGTDKVKVSEYTDNVKVDAGTYKAIATALDNSNYTLEGGTNLEKDWVINKANRNIKFNPETLELTYGTDGYVSFTYSGEAGVVTAISNNIDIVTVEDPEDVKEGTIKVTPVARGTTTVKVTVAENDNFYMTEKEFTVIVKGAKAEITVADPEITLTYGDPSVTTTYEYTGNALQEQISIRSENNNIATAVLTGNQIIVTPHGAGRTKLILTAPETNQYNTVTTEIIVNVNKLPIVLKWSDDEFIYDKTEKVVTAEVENLVGADMVTLVYSGNKETSVGTYTAEVIEIIGDRGSHYTIENGTNVTHEWRIVKAEREVTIQDLIELEYGKNGTITFTYEGEDVLANVTIGDENVAKVNYEDLENSGKITVIPEGAGETTIQVVLPESESYYEKTVSVTVKVTKTSPKLNIEDTELTFKYGDANKNVTFSVADGIVVNVESADPTIATGMVNGNVISVAPRGIGTTTLTVSTVETNQYFGESATITVTVKPRPVILDWGNKNFNYDGLEKTITAVVTNAILGDTVIVEEYTGNKATEMGTYIATAIKLSNPNYTLEGGSNIEVEWVIDRLIPPDIVVRQEGVIIPSGTWASGDVTVTIETLNNPSSNIGYEYSFDGIQWIEYTGTFTYSKETTGQKIYARAYSRITGVAAAENGEYLLKLDKIDPEIELGSVSATNTVNGIINKDSEVTVRLNVNDYVSGIENGEFTIDDVKVLLLHKGEVIELTNIEKTLTQDAANATKQNGSYGYTLVLSKIQTDGRLALRFEEKAVNDRAGRYSRLRTLYINLVSDNTGPDVGMIETSADAYDRLFGDTLDLNVEAHDDSGIKSYEWQVSKDGVTWETFITDSTSAEISEVIYKTLEEGVHHFRVKVTDIIGNYTISEMVSININMLINRKPTIRFEQEQLSPTRVKIIAIVKSTKQIETIKINSSEIDESKWNVVKTNNEITITIEHIAVTNGTYLCTVVDEVGNEVTESVNVTTIDDAAAVITYETYDATEYSLAKIKFRANQDVRISKIINVDGTTTNIINKDDYAGIKFDTVDFATKAEAKLENITFEKGTTFVFENKSFIETYVIIEKDIETKIMYVRTVSTGTKFFDELFGDTFDISKANVLVNQMMAKTKVIYGKVTSYYGVSDTAVKFKVTEVDELKAVSYLAAETSAGEALKINEYGDPVKLKATIGRPTGVEDLTYINGNITGLKVFGNILEWTGAAIKNTFRVTIRAR